MTNAEKVVVAEQITHEIMENISEEFYNQENVTGFAEDLLCYIERQIRPIIRKGADNWVEKYGTN